MASTVLLTGATGIVGQRLTRSLLDAGHHVVMLVRDSFNETAQTRADRLVLNTLPPDERTRVDVVAGDMRTPGCNVSGYDRDRLRGTVDTVWHCAADTRFDLRLQAEIELANVAGTKHLLALAAALGAERFAYISTAFVFGDYEGPAIEVPHPDVARSFSNIYEKSKHAAEKLVTHSPLDWVIFRPPVVVGDARTGEVSGFTGYYGFLRELFRLRQSLTSHPDPAALRRLGADFDGTTLRMDLAVPALPEAPFTASSVDFVCEAMVALAALPAAWGRVFHLVPEASRSNRFWLEQSLLRLRIEGVNFVAPEHYPEYLARRGESRSVLERRVASSFRPYLPYVSNRNTFTPDNQRALLPNLRHARVDEALVGRLLDYAVSANFGLD